MKGRTGTSHFLQTLIFQILIIYLSCSFARRRDHKPDPDTLKLVQVLFRHGDKEPDQTYPGGVGKLTDAGKKQLFDLGEYLRSRYDGYINTNYDPLDISILSSDRDRTIGSAEVLAYGLYKDFNMVASWSEPDANGENIPYEPIPVRTIPAAYDRMILPEKGCPRRVEINDKARADLTRKFYKDNRELLNYYGEHGGSKAKGLLDENREVLDLAVDLYVQLQNLIYEGNHNETLEPWTAPLYASDTFLTFDFDIIRELVRTTEGKRLHGGTFLKHLIENMDKIIEGKDDIKLRLFSGHDQTIQFLLTNLYVDDPRARREPPFGTAVILELHQQRRGKPYLEIYLRNDTQVEPYRLKPSKCRSPCTLEKLKTMTQDFIPTDFESECRAKGDNSNQQSSLVGQKSLLKQGNASVNNNGKVSFGSILTGVSIVAIIAVVFGFVISRHGSFKNLGYGYIPITNDDIRL